MFTLGVLSQYLFLLLTVFSIALPNENLLILVNVHYQQIQEIINKVLTVVDYLQRDALIK